MEPEDPILVVEPDPIWPDQFREFATDLRYALGSRAIRIDHVGSTAVPQLVAKPVIDIQISVLRLEPSDPYRIPIESLGYGFHEDNPDRTKRYFRYPPDGHVVHLHVRRAGSFDEELNLLFRDYLRSHPEDAQGYGQEKLALAERFRLDRDGYVRAKEPVVWKLLQRAHTWSQEVGWSPGPPDV